MLARQAAVERRNLLDDELRVFHAPKLIDVETVGQPNRAPQARARLVKGDRIDDRTPVRGPHPHLQVLLADGALVDDGEVTIPHRFGESGPPRARVAQGARELDVQCAIREAVRRSVSRR